MSAPLTPLPTPPAAPNPGDVAATLARRHLLRGGAVMAGAAGVALVGAVAAPPASAATGQFMVVGQPNTADLSTKITIGDSDGSDDPTLRLENADGPSLSLQALLPNWEGTLEVGDVLNTTHGPLVGVDYGDGAVNDRLVTGRYLSQLPITIPVPPFRILDTRKADQESLLQTSEDGLDTEGRLKGGAWMDVGFVPVNEGYVLVGFHLNITVPKPPRNGHLVAYPSDSNLPTGSSLSFRSGQSTSSAAYVGTSLVGDIYGVRIWTSKTAHVVVDVTGISLTAAFITVEGKAARGRVAQRPAQLAAADAVRKAFS